MATPEVIDVHIHLARDTAQEKVVFPKSGYPDEWFWANPEKIIPYMDREDLSHIFVINYMDTNRMTDTRLSRIRNMSDAQLQEAREQIRIEMVDRVKKFNDWVCGLGQEQPRLVPFPCIDIGLFHDEQSMMEELEEKIKMGAKGVKIHPGLSRFLPSDQRMSPLYDRLQQVGIPILSDSGAAGGLHDGTVYGEPVNFAPVFRDFPKLRFIMAHLCSAFWDERLEIAKEFPEVYFDTAGGFYSNNFHARDGHRACPLQDATRFLRKIGIDRVLFASDGPGHEPRPQIQQIMGLQLTDQEKRKVLAENAKEFMGLT